MGTKRPNYIQIQKPRHLEIKPFCKRAQIKPDNANNPNTLGSSNTAIDMERPKYLGPKAKVAANVKWIWRVQFQQLEQPDDHGED